MDTTVVLKSQTQHTEENGSGTTDSRMMQIPQTPYNTLNATDMRSLIGHLPASDKENGGESTADAPIIKSLQCLFEVPRGSPDSEEHENNVTLPSGIQDESQEDDDSGKKDELIKTSTKINLILPQTPHNTLNASDLTNLLHNGGSGDDKPAPTSGLATSLQSLFETPVKISSSDPTMELKHSSIQ